MNSRRNSSALVLTVASPARKLSPSEVNSGAPHDGSTQRFDLYEQLLHPKFLKVFPCVLGILVGFAACCISGAQIAKTNFYENFHRFTDYTNPTTLYYPTVSQMLAIVNAQSTTEQTVVIVGGNSIFNGIGQRSTEIWTDDLRKTLGSDFVVFNFANCGSQSFEGAYWVAESLLSKGRKVVYVTVAIPTAGGAPEGSKVYGYLFWDAHEKKLLARSPERDSLIDSRLALMDEKEKTRIADLKLRMQMDKVLHFQDLWTSIGYRNLFTVWTQGTASNPFKARRLYADVQPDPRPSATRFSKSIEFPRELATVRGYSDGFFAIQGEHWQPNDTAWAALTSQLKGLVPEPFKKNCLVVIARNPPYFLERITPQQRERIAVATSMSEKSWRAAGYHAITAGADLTDQDFQDCWHLVGAGGKKMSALVARQVLSLNEELGFSAQRGYIQ